MANEELRPIDADHFWIGEVMVDLVQLRYEVTQASHDTVRYSDHQIHNVCVAFDNLRFVAKDLLAGKEPNRVLAFWSLKALNKAGLHTGYVSKEG